MTSQCRFYVLGPPVQDANAVKELVLYLINTTHLLPHATPVVDNLEGPVQFFSMWVPGGRSHILRPGTEAADLWTGTQN